MYTKRFLVLASLLLSVTLILVTTKMFSTQNSENTIETFSETTQDGLYKKIQVYAEQNKIEPIDAIIDRVWKAIPGYNGLEVDIEASYNNMKSGSVLNEKKLIFKEISPKVHLDDLDPSPIFKGNPEKSMISLLINVAWGNEFIPGILKTLHENEVKATFFFDGSWVKANPDLALMIYEEGHEIGNHAYSHPDLQKKSRSETINELKKTNDIIEQTVGIQSTWFAPPSGSFNQNTVEVANELGMKTILWTVDTVDWKKPATTEMVNRVVSKVGNGSMILMHPTKPVFEGLGSMISQIKAQGYQLGTVSDMMSEKRIDPKK